jgi:hypothetical protein
MRNSIQIAISLILLVFAAAGCGRDTTGLQIAAGVTDPNVFIDEFSPGTDFQAFQYSQDDALTQDATGGLDGSNSLLINVPGPGAFAGGAFVAFEARDLSGYDALTFYARASRAETFDIVGLGNDNTGTSRYEASWSSIELTPGWQKFIVPIPLPEKLKTEQGLFYFAEAVENGSSGYQVWLDDVKFEKVGSVISNPRPYMATQTLNPFVGAEVSVDSTRVIFDVDGTDQIINHMPGYFTFASSNDTVASVSNGVIEAVGVGAATITAKFGQMDVTGEVTLLTTAAPTVPAPVPPEAPADVISLFSDKYDDVYVDTWAATWAGASHEVADFEIQGNGVKVYTNLIYAGIEFVTNTIDASSMTHFHMDIWVPEGNVFSFKLVDFGEDGIYGGAPDSEHEIYFSSTSTPPIVTGSWISLDIPFTDLWRLVSREHLAQLIIAGNTKTVFVDNVYFHR